MRKVQDRTTFLHSNTLKDLIAAHLYAVSALADDEEVLTMHIMPTLVEAGGYAIHYEVIKDKEVDVIVHS